MEEELFAQLVKGEITEVHYRQLLKYKDYKVGARVEGIHEYEIKGRKGTIKHIKNINTMVVEFDNRFEYGHDCDGYAETGKGWWTSYENLALIDS